MAGQMPDDDAPVPSPGGGAGPYFPPSPQRRRNRILLVASGVVLLLAFIAVVVGLAVGLSTGGSSSTSTGIAGVQSYKDLSDQHTDAPVQYPQSPPVGGPSSAVLLNCGVYTHPVPAENAVRSLADGAVWITYRPDLADDQVQVLRQIAHDRTDVIVSPYPGLPAPVVASAWGRQLRLQDATDARLTDFLDAYLNGPQAPQPQGACTGGTGTPSA